MLKSAILDVPLSLVQTMIVSFVSPARSRALQISPRAWSVSISKSVKNHPALTLPRSEGTTGFRFNHRRDNLYLAVLKLLRENPI